MKRLLLFSLFTGLGMAALLHFGGGIEGPKRSQPKPVVKKERDPVRTGGHYLPTGDGRKITDLEGFVQTAPPEALVWRDRLSDEVIEIPVFFPWDFKAKDIAGTQPADADRQGAVCSDVRFRVYREPSTRAEAMALLKHEEGAYDALLNQTFLAGEAHVFGRLGEALNRKKHKRKGTALGDTKLILSDRVRIIDAEQGLDIRGDDDTEVTVWPEQGRADGRGPFVMEHVAFELTGDGLAMEHEKEAGWSRVKILRRPVLRIHSDIHDADGKPVFDFGGGDFRPTQVVSRGGAILKREENRRETVITITFTERVHAEQQGGRSLDAGRVEILAAQPLVPSADGASSGWRLQHFEAEEKVVVEYPGQTRKGEAYLASITADRLIHDVPPEGPAMTELEGDVVMIMRGEIPLLGPNGRLRASCRDKAWIGPHRPGSPTGGYDAAVLQQIGLRGEARIERTEHGAQLTEDVLEGDAIDLIVLPKDALTGKAGDKGQDKEKASGMIAVYFAALGDVRLGGTRVRGTTHRLIGEALHTDRPRLLAEGKGTRFSFPDLGRQERLLGPDGSARSTPEDDPAAADLVDDAPKPEWVLQRLLATGMVDIDTSLGGPALGIPAEVTGDELSYNRISQQAQVVSRGGQLARIAWTAPTGEISHLETRTLTVDQAQGRLTAQGGVSGEFYVSRDGDGVSPFGARGSDANEAGLDGSTLTVRTDRRIDIALVRDPKTGKPLLDTEQIIRIAGPLTAELKSANRTVDRMSAEALELGLVYTAKPDTTDTRPMAPTARAGGSGRTTGGAREPKRKPAALERVELTAGEMRLDVLEGEARYIEATKNVEMRSREGRVTGDRLAYSGVRREVEVLADAANWRTRPAAAWLGEGDERMEVTGKRLALKLERADNRPARLEVDAPRGVPAVIQLYRKTAPGDGVTDGLTGTRRRARPSERSDLEWFTLTYRGRAEMTNQQVTIGKPGKPGTRGASDNRTVRIVRRIRRDGAVDWEAPTVLWSSSLRVLGANMLASDGKVRDVRRIVAEGPDTTMRSGRGDDLVQVWGYRFDFDVPRREATLRGRGGRHVRFQRGDPVQVDSEQELIVIDMRTNLPSYVSGSRVLWKPR